MSKNLNLVQEESAFDRSLEIKSLKLTPNTALFWGDDCEDVSIATDIDKVTFDKMCNMMPGHSAFYSGYNDDEMFEILFSMDDETTYDLIESYNDEWGNHIEIITE